MNELRNPCAYPRHVSRGQFASGRHAFALTAVLVVLALLMTILVPFLVGMSAGLAHAEKSAGEAENTASLLGERDEIMRQLGFNQGAQDPTPAADSLDEFSHFDLRGENAGDNHPLGDNKVVSAEVEDLQGRIHVPTAPQLTLANLLGKWSTLGKDLTDEETDTIQVEDPTRFDENGGYVWIGYELIRYDRATSEGLEGLQRGVRAGGDGPPDPYGRRGKHARGSFVVDARVRLLQTYQFDDGKLDRKSFHPWTSLAAMTRVSREGLGKLTLAELEPIRPLVCFAGARPNGGTFGPKQRVLNATEPGITNRLVVRDASSMATGTIVRITANDVEEWSLVVGHRPGSSGTAIRTRTAYTVWLYRPVQVESVEGELSVQALSPVPVNINTARTETLVALFEGIRQRSLRVRDGDHSGLAYPLSRSTARMLADRVVERRGPTPEEDNEHPFTGFEDLMERMLKPMVEEGELERRILFYLMDEMVSGGNAGHWQATIPICFESANLVRYRVAGAVRSGAGSTLARQEWQGIAMPQPAKLVDHIMASQAELDEQVRTTRAQKFMQSYPVPTQLRTRRSAEPPDSAVAYLLPYLHGKAARFPSKQPDDSYVQLAVARPQDLGNGNPLFDFATSDNPEGYDVKRQGLFEIDAGLSIAGAGGRVTSKTAQKAISGARDLLPMYLDNGLGRGIGFAFSAWFKPHSLGSGELFDLSADEPFRNRVSVMIEGGEIVFRAFDRAGLDPDPGETSPDENALKWTVPIAGNAIEADLWFHLGFEIAGFRPSMIVVNTDGRPKGKLFFASHIGNAIPDIDVSDRDLTEEKRNAGLHPPIILEDASTFPAAGVVRIGDELFDYTGKQGNTLITERRDSMGGRLTRRDPAEFRKEIPPDERIPGEDSFTIKLPNHPANCGAELYGYSDPILEDTVVPTGEGRLLSSTLAPWGVARIINGKDQIQIGTGSRPVTLGKGIDETYTGKVDLALPEPKAKAGGEGMPGFDENGGYALIMQYPMRWPTPGNDPRIPELIEVFGVECIRYSKFDGKSLTIQQRGLTIDPFLVSGKAGWFPGDALKFVTDWAKGVLPPDQEKPDPNDWPKLWAYVIPISVGVSGLDLPDPAIKEYSEWLQVYPKGTEAHTEWIRYDKILGEFVLRTRIAAISRLMSRLIGSTSRLDMRNQQQGNNLARDPDWIQPPTGDPSEIGTPSTKENAASYTARLAFRFRGDRNMGTATHDQGSSSIVTPVFRTVIGSLEIGRPGRGDRVALLPGESQFSGVGTTEWGTVNWAQRRFNDSLPRDNANTNQRGSSDPLGPRCNFVALKFGVGAPFSGSKFQDDTRFNDRLVKFPSGELPMNFAGKATVGGSKVDNVPFDGIVDDIQGYTARRWNPISTGRDSQVLGIIREPVEESATELPVGVGNPLIGNIGALKGGGLIWCDGELMGMKEYNRGSGRIVLTQNGRGLLGTEPRAHDVGARVIYVSMMPATYLTSGMSTSSEIIQVQNVGSLPAHEGTVLIGNELMHYTWTRDQSLEMPRYSPDAQDSSLRAEGLYRGRYGTPPQAHGADDMVIAWPFRYWDRYHERCDDPSLAQWTATLDAYDLFVSEMTWEEEIPDATLDIECLARVDERVPWSADPEQTPWLWRFREPQKDDQTPNRLLKQGSRWDFRFQVRYLPGAFDPATWIGRGWKMTPRIKTFGFSYQSETRILQEEQTLR